MFRVADIKVVSSVFCNGPTLNQLRRLLCVSHPATHCKVLFLKQLWFFSESSTDSGRLPCFDAPEFRTKVHGKIGKCQVALPGSTACAWRLGFRVPDDFELRSDLSWPPYSLPCLLSKCHYILRGVWCQERLLLPMFFFVCLFLCMWKN